MSKLRKSDVLEIDPNDPWGNDKLERKAVADYLTPVIAGINQPFVISLHSPYGTGKTFFVKCWQKDLQAKEFKTVYFNAWETDFSSNAFMAFMASIKGQLDKFTDKKTAEVVQKNWTEMAKKAGGFIGRKALPLITKGILRKALGDDGVKCELACKIDPLGWVIGV